MNRNMPNVDEIPNAYSLFEVWGNYTIQQNLPNFSQDFTDW